MSEKREGELKQRFTSALELLMPTAVVLRYATNGAPDREVVCMGVTTRWEFKHGTPEFKSPGDQELMCMRLAAVGHCRYVIWQERKGIEMTLIVHPRDVFRRDGWNLNAEAWCVGFDMEWLAVQVAKEHGR